MLYSAAFYLGLHGLRILSVPIHRVNIVIYEPVPDKTYDKTCATREDSDQLAHLHSLITVLADHVPSTAFGLSKEG